MRGPLQWAGADLPQARVGGGQVRRQRRQLAQLRKQIHPALPCGRVALHSMKQTMEIRHDILQVDTILAKFSP